MARPQNDDRQSQHHPRRHSVRPRADRLAIFLQRAADGEAARADPDPGRTRTSRRRRRRRAHHAAAPGARFGARPPPRLPASRAQRNPSISRDAAIAATPRIKIETPRVSGSISLKGARIDDLSLTQYPRHGRSEFARDRAVLAFGHGASLLCRVRLGAGRGLDGAAPRPRYGVAAGGLRHADADATR